jgi:hypothetical protein
MAADRPEPTALSREVAGYLDDEFVDYLSSLLRAVMDQRDAGGTVAVALQDPDLGVLRLYRVDDAALDRLEETARRHQLRLATRKVPELTRDDVRRLGERTRRRRTSRKSKRRTSR